MLVARAFALGQVLVMPSSWALVLVVDLPRAAILRAADTYAAFGSYLEQSTPQSLRLALLWF